MNLMNQILIKKKNHEASQLACPSCHRKDDHSRDRIQLPGLALPVDHHCDPLWSTPLTF
jgi:hypothetical protein